MSTGNDRSCEDKTRNCIHKDHLISKDIDVEFIGSLVVMSRDDLWHLANEYAQIKKKIMHLENTNRILAKDNRILEGTIDKIEGNKQSQLSVPVKQIIEEGFNNGVTSQWIHHQLVTVGKWKISYDTVHKYYNSLCGKQNKNHVSLGLIP